MQIEAPLIGTDESLTVKGGLVELETQNQLALTAKSITYALFRELRFNSVTERERNSDGTWARFPRSLSLAAEDRTKEDAHKGSRLRKGRERRRSGWNGSSL